MSKKSKADNLVPPPNKISIKELMNFTPKQQEAHKILKKKKYLLFGGALGGGKVVADDGVVLTPFGFKKGFDLCVGDLINNPDGTVQRIIQIKPRVTLERWRVHFSDGTYTDVAEDHLWLAWKNHSRKIGNKRTTGIDSAEVVETQEFLDWLKRGYKPMIPVCQEQRFNVTTRGEKISPYLLGLLLGDGTITSTVCITGNVEDLEWYREQIGLHDTSISLPKTLYFKGQRKKDLMRLLKRDGLLGTKSDTKFIPRVYKMSSIEDRYELVRGLMDTDGYSDPTKNGCYYYTTSKMLADDMAFILRSLGAVVTITKDIGSYKKSDGEKIECKECFNLYIKHPNPDLLFSLKRKQHGFCREYVAKYVSHIEVGGEVTGRCITVSNPNGLYITNDFIVTHNSYWLRWECLYHVIRSYAELNLKGVVAGLFCEDYPALRDRHLSKIRFEFPEWLGKYNSTDNAFILNKSYGNGMVVFRNLDDPSKYQCFHPDTELLTEDGWKNIRDIKVGELCQSFNLETRCIEPHLVTKKWEYDFDGDMIETPNNKSFVAFSVTPNHKVPTRTPRKKKYTLTDYEEMPSDFYIPLNGLWDGEKREYIEIDRLRGSANKKPTRFKTNDFLYFLGWYLSEGCLDRSKRYGIAVSQKNKKKKNKIKQCVERLGFKCHVDDSSVRFNSKSMYHYLERFGLSKDKYIPREFLKLHPKHLQFLFDSLIDGDGHVYKTGYTRFVSISKQLINDVSELGLKLGYIPTIIPTQYEKQRYANAQECWHVGLRKRKEGKVRKQSLVRTPYKGKVHCVTVEPHHTVIIRFRNRVSISGQSSEFSMIAIDELTKNKKETFDYLRSRLRWAGMDGVKFIAATNPGGTGHGWVKKIWIDCQRDEFGDEKDLFAFVQSKAQDNPYLDESYVKSLESLPEEMKRAFLEGDWDVFHGQYFTSWRKDVHVIKPFVPAKSYRTFICGDYGYTNPSAVYWCFKDEDDIVYVYRELYETGLTYDMLMKKICSMTPDNEVIDYIVFDPAIWAKKGDSNLSGAEIMEQTYRDIMGRRPRLIKGNNDRIIGWTVFREYLEPFMKQGRWTARLQIFDTCRNLIREIPEAVHDDVRVEDVDTDGSDHGIDAVRYLLMTKPRGGVRKANTDIIYRRDNILSRHIAY